jgi:hypothetical protein
MMMGRDTVFKALFSYTTLTPLIFDRSERRPFAEKTVELLKNMFTYLSMLDYKPVLYAAGFW